MDMQPMLSYICVFAISLIQSLIATLEVAWISRARVRKAGLMAMLNAMTYSIITIFFVVDDNRVWLIPWYMIGNGLGTAIGTYWGKFNGHQG